MLLVGFDPSVQAREQITYYVSHDGKAGNSKCFSSPFQTLEQARDAVRELDKVNQDFYIRGGECRLNHLFELNAADGGKDICSIAYAIYGDETILFRGDVPLSPDRFTAAKNQAWLNPSAKFCS